MKILGIDPGETSGWCLYDCQSERVLSSGEFAQHNIGPARLYEKEPDHIVVERPKGQGPTFPQVVECGIVFGRIVERLTCNDYTPHELFRYQIRKALQEATHGTVRVTNDASVWAALKLLHGGDECAKKNGQLYGVKSHGRAALAVAVAWSLLNPQTGESK